MRNQRMTGHISLVAYAAHFMVNVATKKLGTKDKKLHKQVTMMRICL